MFRSNANTPVQGLVIPVDIEALCIGTNPGAIFQQNPFDFSKLKNSAYLSSAIASGGGTTMAQGVHLHWALPDALTQGAEGSGSVHFPAVPDRWLVTRVYCDPDKPTSPVFERWVVESNFFAADDPNQPLDRAAISVPYQGSEWDSQPWRYLGKVTPFADWLKDNSDFSVGSAASYVAGLSAVGYGQTDFSASYQNCKSILGFNDLGADLNALGTLGSDKYLSYQILGWYSNPAEDPIRQLPPEISIGAFDSVLNKVADPQDAAFLSAHFDVNTYALLEAVPIKTGQALWSILQAAGYPLDVDIPQNIAPADFQNVLANTPGIQDQAMLKQYYPAQLAPQDNLTDADTLRLWNIMAGAGFDFLAEMLTGAKWSVLSGSVTPSPMPPFTLYSGFISNVIWNANTNYFTNNPAKNFNIAVGNTSGEALSALIANTTGFPDDQVAVVEEILDALQAGILPEATSDSMLDDWEELKETLHKSSFSSSRGGYLWEVQANKNSPQNSGEVTLPSVLALQLNDLNVNQLQYNELQASIASVKSQIFSDWYRFMWISYPGPDGDPSGGIDPGSLAQYITDKINRLTPMQDQATALEKSLDSQAAALKKALGDAHILSPVTAPRYWQPNDPVMLFQGDGIQPSDRYGNDGRYMADGTLVCRLTSQLLTSLKIPAGAFGNAAEMNLSAANFDIIPNPNDLPVLAGIDAALVDGGLLNEDIIAAELRNAGVATSLGDLAKNVGAAIETFLNPPVPAIIAKAQFEAMTASLYPDDADFLRSCYALSGEVYKLKEAPLTDDESLRLVYVLNSLAYNPAQSQLIYAGYPFSLVGIQAWDGNPWLPFSMHWSIYYYPFQPVPSGTAPVYPENFITSQFKFGDTDLEYAGPGFSPVQQGIQIYQNSIFLTPHANINLQKQLAGFIAANPKDPLIGELNAILAKLGDKPVLSQAMSGFDEALLMLQKEMQLPVADPNPSPFYDFTNTTVHDAVDADYTERPATGNSYNPIRVGLMQIAEITLVDVFGRNVRVVNPNVVYRSQSMQQTVMTPITDIYLPPRITQPSRLLFRWLSADDDTVEMNTHPATTPICGWILANHLDDSLWVYDNKGNAYGSLGLNWNKTQVLWQCAPGSAYFGFTAPEFFAALGVVNKHLQGLILALYGKGDAASATYLDAFMRALDISSATIEPGNYAQFQGNAVLLGRPLALVRASLDLEMMGEPAYNQSWSDLSSQVTQDGDGHFVWGNDYGFTKVNFPVKIGNIPQTSDGLIGYFKNDAYDTFYAPAIEKLNPHVLPPPDDNLVVNASIGAPPVYLSMLVEPRGVIHATTGILPVKTIEIPPDQYSDALEKMCLAFLTAPILTPKNSLAMPVPAQSGGAWNWVENDGATWSQSREIASVTVDAVMNYAPQRILEGWINLSNALISAASFQILNVKANKPVIYMTSTASLNAMTLTWSNKTNTPVVLNGGEPVPQSYQTGGSSLAFNFGDMLPEGVVAGMQVTSPGWKALYFPATLQHPALWSAAPEADMVLAPGAQVIFNLNGITCPLNTPSGNLEVYYFALPDFPDNVIPLLFPVTTLMPPSQGMIFMATADAVNFSNSSFACINDMSQSLVLYSTLDTSWNAMTFTLHNNTGSDLSLIGGEPVNGIQTGGASSFTFSFRTILTDAQASVMSVVDSKKQWGSLYFPPGTHSNPTWAVAPLADMVLKSGDSVVLYLGNIQCTSQTPSYFDVLYYNIPGVNPRAFPFPYIVSVLNPPTGKDLKSVLDCGILNGSVQHLIQPAPYPPPGGNGPEPVEIDITYDNNFPIQNGFTLYLKNNSNQPLVPPGTLLGGATFTITFLFATDDEDAITTQSLGDGIVIDIDAEPPSQWSSSQHSQGTGNWVFTPLSQPLIPANQTVNLDISQIITALNVNPQKLSSMHVQWNFIPGYADGYYSVELQKQTATPDIYDFSVTPQVITVGDPVTIAYRTEVAAYVVLEYSRRDDTQVVLKSLTDIGFDESAFVPAILPDKENTVFTLSVYRGPGLPATNTRTVAITVNQLPAVIKSFTASSQLVDITKVNKVTLSWQVQNAKSVTLQGFGLQTGNSLEVTLNTTTTFTLEVAPWGTSGKTAYATLTVYAYKTLPCLDVGPMGTGLAFQSLPVSISNKLRGIVYVANSAANKVYQVLQATHAVSPVTFPGNILSLTSDGLKLFVAQAGGSGPGTISMFDTATGAQVCSLAEPGPPPYSLAINPAGTQMYYQQQHRLTAVSAFNVNEAGNSFAYVKDLAVGTSPEAYAFDATGSNLYVGNYDSANVSVINLAQNLVTATIALQSSEPCDFALVGTVLFVACSGDNQVCVIDTTNNTTLPPIKAGFQPFSLTLDQNKARLFVTNFQGGTVTVIDTASRQVITTLTVGNGPSAAKISDSGSLLFVSNYCDKSLSVVDISNGTQQVLGTIDLGQTNGNPIGISTYPENNNYTDVFIAKEYFQGRNNGCTGTTATDANLNISILSIQEKSGLKAMVSTVHPMAAPLMAVRADEGPAIHLLLWRRILKWVKRILGFERMAKGKSSLVNKKRGE